MGFALVPVKLDTRSRLISKWQKMDSVAKLISKLTFSYQSKILLLDPLTRIRICSEAHSNARGLLHEIGQADGR